MEKLAIFDVDGTLFDGNLGIELVKILVNDKVFPEDIGNKAFSWYKKYKNGEVEKAIAIDSCYNLYNIGLKNHTMTEIQNVASKTWELVKDNSFRFTRELLDTLKKNNYTVVLLSGSPMEMLSLFGKEYDIEEKNILAGISETLDNIYTGNLLFYLGSSEQKISAITKYITENKLDVDWNHSIGMGDNERDAGILELVGHAFAINPNEKLRAISNEKNYQIVDENNALQAIIEVIG